METTIPPVMSSLLFFILAIALTIGIAIFICNIGDKTQVIPKKVLWINISITSFAGIVYLLIIFLIFLSNFILTIQWVYPILIIIVIFAGLITKIISVRLIKIPEYIDDFQIKPNQNILEIKDLKVSFPVYGGFFRKKIAEVKAVDGVSFKLKTGETFGIVGESGCGKSTIARTILGLIPRKSGEIIFEDHSIGLKFPREIRQRIQMVFQDLEASLNPRMKVVDIISEPLRNFFGITNKKVLRRKVLEVMERVSLKPEHLDRFPHEFSGGQKQRIINARSLICNPYLIVLDEPTSALDVSVQAKILNILKNLQKSFNYAFIFITHNLAVVSNISDKIAVMYLGDFVEIGKTEEIFSNPSHPYTQALLSARTDFFRDTEKEQIILEGEVPSAINPPSGCKFHPRCFKSTKNHFCTTKTPKYVQLSETHFCLCDK